jgi:hypothetical protein
MIDSFQKQSKYNEVTHMDGKLIALTLVLVIVAVLCAWIVSTAFTGSQMSGDNSDMSVKNNFRVSMSIKEPLKPIDTSFIVSMSILEPEGLRGE